MAQKDTSFRDFNRNAAMMNWKDIFKRKKQDSVFEVIEVIQTINNRKLKHLHDCIVGMLSGSKIPYTPPQTFITPYEATVLERMHGEKADEIKKLVLKSFDEIEIEK